jgi:hypothetical protein
MKTKRKVLLLLFFSGFCIASLAQDATKTYSALNGIWHIAGARGPSHFPFLALSIAVNGDTVYGTGSLEVTCSNRRGSGQGTTVSVIGNIAGDGSFLLTNTKGEARFAPQVSIRGRIPAGEERTWGGSLTIATVTAWPDCAFRDSRDFVATPYPTLSGTYTGTINGPDLGAGLTISLQITQTQVVADDAFRSDDAARPDELSPSMEPPFYTPLNATIAVSGYRRFTAEAVATKTHMWWADRVAGDGFSLEFPVEDGSTVALAGHYTKLSGSTLEVLYGRFVNGKPTKEIGSGNLARQ